MLNLLIVAGAALKDFCLFSRRILNKLEYKRYKLSYLDFQILHLYGENALPRPHGKQPVPLHVRLGFTLVLVLIPIFVFILVFPIAYIL